MTATNNTEELLVRVDRGEWLRGLEASSVLLHPHSGHKCCMGFAAAAAGTDAARMRNVPTIAGLLRPPKHPALGSFCPVNHTEEHCQRQVRDPRPGNFKRVRGGASLIYELNDDFRLSDDERERYLTSVGERLGIRFQFHGNPLPRQVAGDGPTPTRRDAFPELDWETPLPERTHRYTMRDQPGGEWTTLVRTPDLPLPRQDRVPGDLDWGEIVNMVLETLQELTEKTRKPWRGVVRTVVNARTVWGRVPRTETVGPPRGVEENSGEQVGQRGRKMIEEGAPIGGRTGGLFG